jgi:hypothetical protein
MTRLLHALREKFSSPQAACEALGIEATALPAHARFQLAADAKSVRDKQTGRTYATQAFAKALFDTTGGVDPMLTTLQRRLAHDADLPAKAGIAGDPKPNLDQDPNGGAAPPPNADELIQLIQLMMSKMPDQQEFAEKLAALISGQEGPGTGDQGHLQNEPGAGAGDRRRAGARDKRKPAQDAGVRSLNNSAFLRRFPFLPARDGWR